jgi:hypothetical protein
LAGRRAWCHHECAIGTGEQAGARRYLAGDRRIERLKLGAAGEGSGDQHDGDDAAHLRT